MLRLRTKGTLRKWANGLAVVGAIGLVVGIIAGADNARAAPPKALVSTCSACHGANGNSTDPQYPKLAGQKASYLAAQLHDFKSGTRKSDAMSAMASSLTDQQIGELARYFSREPIEADVVKNARLTAQGSRIFLYGSRGVLPCAACHASQGGRGMGMMMGMRRMGGMGMMGNMGVVPNINGQHAAYVVQQLDAFANGGREGTVMNQISKRMSEADRKAVAAYVSGLR